MNNENTTSKSANIVLILIKIVIRFVKIELKIVYILKLNFLLEYI